MNRTFRIEKFKRSASLLALAAVATLIVACGSGDDESGSAGTVEQPEQSDAVAAAPEATTAPVEDPTSTVDPPTVTPEPTVANTAIVEPTPTPEFAFAYIEDDVERMRAQRLKDIWGWNTDLNHKNIDLLELEIVLPKDRIIPIDEPNFKTVANAPNYMEAREPVVAVIVNGEAKAYPLAILMWHEIVNDTIGGVPVTVTFCPLCNTGITFERVVDGLELDFGTSGMLRKSDLVMWDRQTESYWQQITGEALAGDYAADDTVLKQIPSSIIAWETFVESYPDGHLLERVFNEHGSPTRPYDLPPYAGYDDVDTQPFLFRDTPDDRLVATSRVLTIDGETPVAYPFEFLKETPVLNDTIDGNAIVALFDYETFSAFNDITEQHKTSGSVAVFSRDVDGQTLTFKSDDMEIVDIETGSVWSVAGIATSGELEGTALVPVIHANHFWFAWAVFKPNTVIKDSVDDLTG
jgi:hypothetical protein